MVDKLQLELEQSRMLREKARVILDKSTALYGLFMIVSLLGFFYDRITAQMLALLVAVGILILILGAVPYLVVTSKEERRIEKLLGDRK
ncbi:hypothetical protein J4419_02615 [Candidatus Woesearchaeota archaeon]|nr:hypothetical protein [Candidatus Woesearchaeota archaeon]